MCGAFRHTRGVQMYGGIKMYGAYRCPLSLTTPIPASKVETSYLKLNSYT